MAEQAQFELLLQSLLSTENEVRTQAEASYNGLAVLPKLQFLLSSMKNTALPDETRQLASVLLRRVFTSSFEEFWHELSPDFQNVIKAELMGQIQQETNQAVRKKICEALSELARNLLDDNGNNTWPEVLQFLFQAASASEPVLKECALYIFGTVPGIFGNQQGHYLNVIKEMLHQCLNDEANPKVRFEAVKAATSFLVQNEEDQQLLSHLKDLLPGIVKGVGESAKEMDDDTLLKCLVEIAENTPKYLRSQLAQVIDLCIEITGNAEMLDQWRHLALEVIVTLSEEAPAMLRKYGTFIPKLVPIILALMVDLEDDADWAFTDEIEDDDNDSNAIAGESALDRLACGLGGKTIIPHIIANVPQMLQHADWRYRHAALMAVSACGEGCHKQMETMLASFVEAVLPFLQDPHPRVRYAACNAIGQMSTDFGPVLQKKFHDKVVPGLLIVMGDYQHPRVQAHAGAALINFSEDCPKNILAPYLDKIIAKLEEMLSAKLDELRQKGTKLVLEQVVTTLASVADTAEEKFILYYDKFMPSLKYIMQNAGSTEHKLLRGKTIECISLIGLAVGSEKFMPDCSEVMQLLLKTQMDEGDMPEDDPQMSYMISAWARMCKIMGKDFAQYLPLVMGPVLKAASIKPEVAVVDNEEVQSLDGDQDKWQFITLGDQQSFGIKTAGLEEKATACQMLVCYARELKEVFAEYTEQVVKIMVPMLKFYFNDECRVAGAESLPFLIDCARIKGDNYVKEMWDYICPNLLKAIETEPEKNILGENLNSLGECIQKLGMGCLNEQQFTDLGQLLEKTMQEHYKRQTERQERRKDEDYDEVVEEDLLEEDDEDVYILSKVSDVIHALIGTHKEQVLPFFEKLMPLFNELMAVGRPWPDLQWGLCIWDDVIEHTGQSALKYKEHFLPPLMRALTDQHPEVRQAACYGLGVAAMTGVKDYYPVFSESLPYLISAIEHPDSRTVEVVNATENSISAIAKICKYAPESVNVNEIIPHLFKWLPTWEDKEESEHIYGFVCDLVESNHPLVLGENNSNIPALITAFAEALARDALEKDSVTGKRIATIVNQIKTNEAMYVECVKQLSEAQVLAIQQLIT